MNKLSVGTNFEFHFRLTQRQVEQYAELSGDKNPIHFDEEAAARCAIGRLSVQGLLGAFVFSRVLGTIFPGYGTVYHSQSLRFKRPMFVETDYVATFTIQKIIHTRHVAKLSTVITEKASGKTTTQGTAVVVNETQF